ncbi:MAG: MATE family efflux transporter [Lachnospiraceae bacterium]|nr:MATE family efflux transporter [Lachnospiraceae bacterium]
MSDIDNRNENDPQIHAENKMGVMPINKLIINIGLPMILSMLVQAFYNIVDSIFVARIKDAGSVNSAGTAALVAVGMAFPFQMLLVAVGAGTGVGVNSLLSKALGEKDMETVKKAANNGIFLSIVSAVVFFIIGRFFAGTLIHSQGGEGLSLKYGTQYLSIVCMCSFGIFMQFIFERLLQSTGRTLYSMITQMTGAVINIILDPILIFGMFGFPELKVAGAAVATVTGQIVAACMGLYLNLKKNPEITIDLRGFKPDGHVIRRIYMVGIPTMIMQSIGSVMTYCMNKILVSLNDAAVAVFTVYFKLQSLFFMPLFGLNNGLIPILAYNYGAQKRSRMVKAIKISMAYAFGFAAIGFLMFEVIPDKLLLIFNTGDSSLITYGVPALRIIAWHYLLAWFCIVGGTVYQSLGNGVYSLIVSVARQLVVLIPAAYILAKLGGLDLIWWSFPVAELMSFVVNCFFMYRINKNIISKVGDNV